MEAFSDITAPTVYIYMLILVVYVCEKKKYSPDLHWHDLHSVQNFRVFQVAILVGTLHRH